MANGAVISLVFSLALAGPAQALAATAGGANIDVVELRQSDESLRATYAKGKLNPSWLATARCASTFSLPSSNARQPWSD
ncbi:hypothetical protein [Dokdonella soli]|uniref:Uncharacterized protein n=1 Tax=Dokdonella soli TaxID=529810 RepID=A0ABN1IXW2_9GAMM